MSVAHHSPFPVFLAADPDRRRLRLIDDDHDGHDGRDDRDSHDGHDGPDVDSEDYAVDAESGERLRLSALTPENELLMAPLRNLTREQRDLISQYLREDDGATTGLLLARFDLLDERLADHMAQTKERFDRLEGKGAELDAKTAVLGEQISDTMKIQLHKELDAREKELDELRHTMGLQTKEEKHNARFVRETVLVVLLTALGGGVLTHFLEKLFTH